MCSKCNKEQSGYDASCIDCCSRLIMSTGRKTGDASKDLVIDRQRQVLFAALEAFPMAPKRAEIVAHIRDNFQ